MAVMDRAEIDFLIERDRILAEIEQELEYWKNGLRQGWMTAAQAKIPRRMVANVERILAANKLYPIRMVQDE